VGVFCDDYFLHPPPSSPPLLGESSTLEGGETLDTSQLCGVSNGLDGIEMNGCNGIETVLLTDNLCKFGNPLQ